MKEALLGLVRLRKVTSKEPKHLCENCNCKRYSPCCCKKAKGGKNV